MKKLIIAIALSILATTAAAETTVVADKYVGSITECKQQGEARAYLAKREGATIKNIINTSSRYVAIFSGHGQLGIFKCEGVHMKFTVSVKD